ncbi:hypothetical protein Nm8I071_63090 [Nonomuraea sp. TT08I-71]|nr:hypothetical protein Nm8I071_63090 [Nonomuraea sp. TT08I-71]
MIAAQSAADCLPSTVSVPKPPSRFRYVSTAFWCSPCGHPADFDGLGVAGFGVVLREGFGVAVRLGVADGDALGCSGVGGALAPDASSVTPTGAGAAAPDPSPCGSRAHAPTPTSTTAARQTARTANRTRFMGPPLDSCPAC